MRKAAFRNDLLKERDSAARHATFEEFFYQLFKHLSLIFGVCAAIGGLIKGINVPVEMVGRFAALSTGFQLVYKEAKYRVRADWFYELRDAAQQFIFRIDYETPFQINVDEIETLSKEWRQVRANLASKMIAIKAAGEGIQDEKNL